MRAGHWVVVLGVALALSVALNAFLLGAASARRDALQAAGPGGLAGGPAAFAHSMPAELRRAFRAELRRDLRGLSRDLRGYRAARAAVVEALRAEDFDPEEIERRMALLRAASTAVQLRLHRAFAAAAAQAEPEARAQIPYEAPGAAAVRARLRQWLGSDGP